MTPRKPADDEPAAYPYNVLRRATITDGRGRWYLIGANLETERAAVERIVRGALRELQR